MHRNWRDLLRLRKMIARRLTLTQLSLTVERLTAALWAPLVLLGGFLAVAWLNILPALPALLHISVLMLFCGGFIFLAYKGLSTFSWPTAQETRHRLETGSTMHHRPLTAWEDTITGDLQPGQGALWSAHLKRVRRVLSLLRVPWPGPVVPQKDRFALRAGVIVLCTITALGAGDDLGPRLVRAVTPALAAETGPIDVRVWITPPEYTQLPPVMLDPSVELAGEEGSDIIQAPANSRVLAVVTGSKRPTRLNVGETSVPLEVMSDNSLRYEGPLPEGRELELRQTGRLLGSWDLDPISDQAPAIAFIERPDETGRWRMRLRYRANDDYGIAEVKAQLRRPEDTRPYALAWNTDVQVAVPPLSPREVEHQSFHDLTAHPWAGMEVTLQLLAIDQAGQKGMSEAISLVLPERTFTHPVAAKVIRYRKELIKDPTIARMVARGLGRVVNEPESYGGDITVHLALTTARARLEHSDIEAELDSIIDLMWRASVRLEDGTLGVAEKALDEAERALSEAIEQGASPEEINRLIAQLQRALMQYLSALAEQMPDSQFPITPNEQDFKTIGAEDLAKMMEELRQLNEMGAEDAAKQMLANLQNMLQQLRNTAQGQSNHPDIEAARAMMQELKDITQQQSEMLNESFEESRQSAFDREETASGESEAQRQQDAAEKQDQLRQQLGDLMGRMAEMTGQVPGSLGNAEQAMRTAEEALQSGSWQGASENQGEALHHLQSSLQEAAGQMMQALAQRGLGGFIPMPSGAGQPFGATGPNLGPDEGQDIELPTEPDAKGLSQRSRAILDEIRRRAGDRLRSSEERDYLRRLLKEF